MKLITEINTYKLIVNTCRSFFYLGTKKHMIVNLSIRSSNRKMNDKSFTDHMINTCVSENSVTKMHSVPGRSISD